jgi:hypothetical protein
LVPLLSPHIFSLYFKYYVAPYDLHSVIYSQKGSLSDAMYLSDVHCLLLEFKNEDSTFKISDATHDAGCVYHRIFVEIFCMLPWTFFSSKKPNDCHDSRAIMCNLMPAVARLKCCRCRQTDSNTSWRSNGMNCRLWSLRMLIHRSVVLQIWTNNFDFHWISGQQSLLTLSLVSLSDKATLLSWIDFFLNNKNYYIDKRREYSPSRTEYTRRFVTRQYNCSTTSNCQVITQGGLPHNDTEPDEWWAQASQNTLGLLCSLRA